MYTSAASCTITHVSFSRPVQGANRCRALVQDPHRVWFLWYSPCLGDWGLSMGVPNSWMVYEGKSNKTWDDKLGVPKYFRKLPFEWWLTGWNGTFPFKHRFFMGSRQSFMMEMDQQMVKTAPYTFHWSFMVSHGKPEDNKPFWTKPVTNSFEIWNALGCYSIWFYLTILTSSHYN